MSKASIRSTAWSPPFPVIVALSEKFPNLLLSLHYEEPGVGFRGDFECRGGECILNEGDDNWYVLKGSVPYQLWNRLIGVENPERLDQADDR